MLVPSGWGMPALSRPIRREAPPASTTAASAGTRSTAPRRTILIIVLALIHARAGPGSPAMLSRPAAAE